MPRVEDEDAGSWCVEDWEGADFDLIPPPYEEEKRWGTCAAMTWTDSQLRSPWFEDIVLSNESEDVVSGREMIDMIREQNDEFHEQMLNLVLDVHNHHASLIDRLKKSKQGEYFVEAGTEYQKIDKQVQAGEDDNAKDTNNSDKRSEMQLLMKDFMKCSFNENFNWDERISRPPGMSKFNEETTTVGQAGTTSTVIDISKNDVKDVLKDFTDENVATMKILVEEVKEANEKLINMLLRDTESTNRCLSEIEKDLNEMIMPKGKGNATEPYHVIEEHEGDEDEEEKVFTIDFDESESYCESKEWEEGLLIDFEDSCYGTGWEDACLMFEDGDDCNESDEDWEKEIDIKDMQIQPLKKEEELNSMMEDFWKCSYLWDKTIARNSGIDDSLVEISESGMIVEEFDHETDVDKIDAHNCDAKPLCQSCTEQQNEDDENLSLQCNECNSPAMCLTCLDRRNQQLVLPSNRLFDIRCHYTAPDHIWYPGPWAPLRLSLVEKVKELDAREQDALLIGKWIRMNEPLRPVLGDNIFRKDESKITEIEEDKTEERCDKMNEEGNEIMDEKEVTSNNVEVLNSSLEQTNRKWNGMSEEVKTVLRRNDRSNTDLDQLINTWVDEVAMAEQWKSMIQKINDVTDNRDVCAHDVTELIAPVAETSTEMSPWIKMGKIVSNISDDEPIVNADFNDLLASFNERWEPDILDGEWDDMNKKLNVMINDKTIKEFIESLDIDKIQVTRDMVIEPDVKLLVDSMMDKVSSIDNEWEEFDDKLPPQKGAEKSINDFGYMWEFLV